MGWLYRNIGCTLQCKIALKTGSKSVVFVVKCSSIVTFWRRDFILTQCLQCLFVCLFLLAKKGTRQMTSVFLYSVYRRKIVKQGKCLKRIVFNLFSMSRLNSTVGRRELKLNHVNTDTEGNRESVRIKWVEFRKNARAFFPQGQSNCS